MKKAMTKDVATETVTLQREKYGDILIEAPGCRFLKRQETPDACQALALAMGKMMSILYPNGSSVPLDDVLDDLRDSLGITMTTLAIRELAKTDAPEWFEFPTYTTFRLTDKGYAHFQEPLKEVLFFLKPYKELFLTWFGKECFGEGTGTVSPSATAPAPALQLVKKAGSAETAPEKAPETVTETDSEPEESPGTSSLQPWNSNLVPFTRSVLDQVEEIEEMLVTQKKAYELLLAEHKALLSDTSRTDSLEARHKEEIQGLVEERGKLLAELEAKSAELEDLRTRFERIAHKNNLLKQVVNMDQQRKDLLQQALEDEV